MEAQTPEKKKTYSGIVLIAATALIIGFLISVQINALKNTATGGLIPVSQAAGLQQQLKDVQAEKAALNATYLDLEQKLREIEESTANNDALVKSLTQDVSKYKMSAGVIDVKGPGVIITVDDPPPATASSKEFTSVIMARYDLLLELVNKLKDAGAEAISINGQRVVAGTEISLAGNNVNINTIPTAPPYTVKAIGNPDTLESTLSIRYGIIDIMRSQEFNLQVTITKEKNIEIPRFTGVIKYRYAKPAEDAAGSGK